MQVHTHAPHSSCILCQDYKLLHHDDVMAMSKLYLNSSLLIISHNHCIHNHLSFHLYITTISSLHISLTITVLLVITRSSHHYITLHYITLTSHYITLTSHYITLTSQYITLTSCPSHHHIPSPTSSLTISPGHLNTKCGFIPSCLAAMAVALAWLDWMLPQVMTLSQPRCRATARRNSSLRIYSGSSVVLVRCLYF